MMERAASNSAPEQALKKKSVERSYGRQHATDIGWRCANFKLALLFPPERIPGL
jgi:hypothetical protein